jgi:glycosyltransferase involved in cell wall biosynthesis
MRIAFVGVHRDYQELARRRYVEMFDHSHLELPWYYAACGRNDVYVVTENYESEMTTFSGGGSLIDIDVTTYRGIIDSFDVIIHWREWQWDLWSHRAVNVMHTCDHTYPEIWIKDVLEAYSGGKLKAILCHPAWHKRQLRRELSGVIPLNKFVDGITSGVDDLIFKPSPKKDRFSMLWASDPGRGLKGAIELATQLYMFDRRFRLHVTYPDYAERNATEVDHPAIVWHGVVPNGPQLWDMFNEAGILPYTSTFLEPSSRTHRQAQAAGCLVAYPANMGSPSELIRSDQTGLVIDGGPGVWVREILRVVNDRDRYDRICAGARLFAESESWSVQAERFNDVLRPMVDERRKEIGR